MPPLLEILATLAAGLFAGAAVYVTAVEHPARVSCGPVLAVNEFRPSYARGTVMQVTLALIGALAVVVRWGVGGHLGWLLGGLLLGAVVPFTLIVILPTNELLLGPALDLNSSESATLLRRWGRLHAVRSAASLVAFLVFVFLLAR
jgi:Domain of unknown function (DUF1772)